MSAMRHVLTLQRAVSSRDEFGGAVEVWIDRGTVRALIVGGIEQIDNQGAAGAIGAIKLVFETRLLLGSVELGDRVLWLDRPYQIKGVTGTGIAGNAGLRLHCEGRL